MSLRDSMRTHRKSMMKRLSFNPLQAFAGHTEGGSKAPTLVEGDSASSEDGQGADASSGDASSPVSPETTEAQHLADFKKEERPPIDDHYRPHLEELGQWPDDQLLKQLRAHGHLDAYSEATLLETRRNTLGALESTLKYHECYVKEQIRQADDPVTYPEVELPRMRAGEEGQLNAPRTYQPRHIRFPREISIGGTTAEFEDACKWLRGQGQCCSQPKDICLIGKIASEAALRSTSNCNRD